MSKPLLAMLFSLASLPSHAATTSSFLRDLCNGKEVDIQITEAEKATRIYQKLRGSELRACKERDDAFLKYLIEKYERGITSFSG